MRECVILRECSLSLTHLSLLAGADGVVEGGLRLLELGGQGGDL